MIFSVKPAGEAFTRNAYPENALFFFDFDGVLADQEEEKVYRLEDTPLERGELEALARLHGMDPSLYPSTGYLRHLIYQSQVFDLPVKPHTPAVEFARDLCDTGNPYFVVTARSGRYAVDRMMRFVDRWCLYPHEVFCLGRSSKAALLTHLRKDWPDRPFVFFEDSKHHIDAAMALGDPLLAVVQIEWPTCTKTAEALRREHLGI